MDNSTEQPMGWMWRITFGLSLSLAMSANAITTVPLFDIAAIEQAVSVHSSVVESQEMTCLRYDPLGRLSAYTNPAGQAFRLAWDAQGRLVAATNALGEEVQRLAYDAAGNLVEKIDGAGRSAVFSYDSLNRATNAAYSDGTNLSFAFDAAGSLIRTTGPGATNTFGYGADGALAASTSTAGGVTFEVRYLRDLVGNVTNLTYPDGRRVAYDYDAENRLAEVRDWNGRVYRFEKDGVGRVLGVSYPNGVTNSWTRDQAGRVTGWRYEKSSTALLERDFTLDAVGRILEADYAAGPQPIFPATRRLDFTHNAADRITASGVYSGTNVENSVWLYDGAGAVTNGGGRSYAYGARGLLERAWGTNVDFEAGYDALGNRIWERSGGVERRFAVNHADPFKRPLVETDAAGAVVRRYVWGPDRLLAIEEADGTLRVALTDERGSVAGLTDATGALTDTFVYGPYGEDWGRTGTNVLAFRWLGGYGVRHAGGSLYVTRFRAYDADARRFLSADPLGLAGGGNLYAYGAGDPMFFIDPLGLEAVIRQGDNDLYRYVRMVERNLVILGYDVFISPFMEIANAQTEFLKDPTVEGACDVIRPFTATLLLILLGMPAESVPVKGSVTLLEDVGTKHSVTILEREGNIIEGSFEGAAGEARVITEMVRDGDTLILRGTHIQGQGTLKEALEAAKQLGREQGVKKVIIESARRTTGANPGHIPRSITIETGL